MRGQAGGFRVLGALALAWMVCLFVPNVVFALPEGRHYEMVSPIYKGGYGVEEDGILGVAAEGGREGESIVYRSKGTFKGALNNKFSQTYLARRGTTEWSTNPLLVPSATSPAAFLTEFSPTLESFLYLMYPGANSGVAEAETTEPEFLVEHADALEHFEPAGGPLKRLDDMRLELGGAVGSSPDLCHILFYTGTGHESQPLLPEAEGTNSFLYELESGTPGCGTGRKLRLVGVGNELGPNEEPSVLDKPCIVYLGASDAAEGNSYNAIAADGAEIFFTTNKVPVHAEGECDTGEHAYPSNPAILYVRLDGEKTVEISKPIETDCSEASSAPCASASQERAEFVGANEAGTRAYFITKQPLVTGDTDEGKDVYLANLGCPPPEPKCRPGEQEVTSLTQVSQSEMAGEAAEVQGVSDISPDGSHVYFVARGVLSGVNAEGHSPVKGADNFYVYNAEDGTLKFIADLCSGPGLSGPGGSLGSGAVEDSQCPDNLATGGSEWGEVQVAGKEGRFLIFASYARLTPDDTDTARDIYRYDAQTGRLERVSVGEDGYDANGNNNEFSAVLPPLVQGGNLRVDDEMGDRAISDDGSRIVFETAEPLSPDAVNGLVNAYEWHGEEGSNVASVSLVSSGSDEAPVGEDREEVAISPSGRDIFFITVQGLVMGDTDGAKDIYDARLGGGFPTSAGHPQPCSGDACQGPLTNPAPLLVPGSEVQKAGENLAPPRKATIKKKAKKKTTKKKKATHKKKTKDGKASSKHSRGTRKLADGGGR